MLPKPTSSQTTKKGTDFQYDGSELGSIVEGVERFFKDRKYHLESGDPDNGTYGTGSNLMRVFFGAFAKRYSFSVKVRKSEDQRSVVFLLEKAMSGAMGGAIGFAKMTKAYNAIVDELNAGTS